MADVASSYTPAQAAVLGEIDIKTINNAIDKGVIVVDTPTGGRARRLNDEDVLLLKLWHEVGSALAADGRQRVFDAVRASPTADRVRADEFLIVDVAAARRKIKAKRRDLDKADLAIHRQDGIMAGEPVFKGTRIPVRLLTNMLRDGASRAEILEGYPRLDNRLLDLALLWAAANPARGRPKSLAEYGAVAIASRRLPLGRDAPSLNVGA